MVEILSWSAAEFGDSAGDCGTLNIVSSELPGFKKFPSVDAAHNSLWAGKNVRLPFEYVPLTCLKKAGDVHDQVRSW